ncbi:unnamed protein product [Lupinus luteus]|uniref:Uncharacterized protein n=1 Tax=Lupinus luteus TaxID=3873 RepID=A0AAV1WN71_LUPLU
MESKNLDCMSLATLFGKLHEHEMELAHLTMIEESDKSGISLKVTRFQEDQERDNSDYDSDEEDLTLVFEKFHKYLNKKGEIKNLKIKEANKSTKKGKIPKEDFTCFEYGKSRHMKQQCPSYFKKAESNSRKSKSKGVYIVWDTSKKDSTSSSSDDKEITKQKCA